MKLTKNRLTVLLAVPVLALASGAALRSGAALQEGEPPSAVDMAAMQAKAMELMMPGPEHEQLARWAGTWNAEVKIWMAPGSEPMLTENTTSAEMVLGGRFLQVNATGEFMGMPWESSAMMGFDRRSDEFTSVGFDTLGTYFVTAKGKYDEESKTLTLSGEDYDASMDHTQVYEFVYEWIDADTYTMAVVFLDPVTSQGQAPFKMVDITYRRSE